MEAIGNSFCSSSLQYRLISHRLCIPHDEFCRLCLPIINERHTVAIIFFISIISWREKYFTSSFSWSKVHLFDNLFFLMIVFNKSLEVKILLTNLIKWKLFPKVRDIRISILLANKLLIDYWEFQGKIINHVFHICFSSGKIEGILS